MKYVLLKEFERSDEELNGLVQVYLADGWELYGSPSCSVTNAVALDGDGFCADRRDWMTCQAMIKKDE